MIFYFQVPIISTKLWSNSLQLLSFYFKAKLSLPLQRILLPFSTQELTTLQRTLFVFFSLLSLHCYTTWQSSIALIYWCSCILKKHFTSEPLLIFLQLFDGARNMNEQALVLLFPFLSNHEDFKVYQCNLISVIRVFKRCITKTHLNGEEKCFKCKIKRGRRC